MGQNPVSIFQFHPEGGIGQRFHHFPLDLNGFLFRQTKPRFHITETPFSHIRDESREKKGLLNSAMDSSERITPRSFREKAQHLRPVLRHGNGVLEMGGRRTILGDDRPTVALCPYLISTGIDHRLNRQNHPSLQAMPGMSASEIWNLGILVRFPSDAVPHQITHDRIALCLNVNLNGV
jgi:hypothetical protein